MNDKLKSLGFYSLLTLSVVVMFKLITTYGETKIKAPMAINNNYQLKFKEKLPNCNKTDTLLLNIQQSGIYLHGSLLPKTTELQVLHTQPNLTGNLQHQKLSLSGKVPQSIFCDASHTQDKINKPVIPGNLTSVTMEIFLQPNRSTGQITIDKVPSTIEFTAIPTKL